MSDSTTIMGDLASASPTLARLVAEGKIPEHVARTIPARVAKVLQHYTIPEDAPERLREFSATPLRRFFNLDRVVLPPDLEACFLDDGGFGAYVCGAIRKAIGHWRMSQDAALDMTMAEYYLRLQAEEETDHEHRLLLRDEIGKVLEGERQADAPAERASGQAEVQKALSATPGWEPMPREFLRRTLEQRLGHRVSPDVLKRAIRAVRKERKMRARRGN